MNKNNVTVKTAGSREELIVVEELQRKTFEFSSTEIVGANELTTFQKNGGAVFVAINNVDNRIIGYLFGFPSIYENQLCHHSVSLGVLSEYRLSGIGYRLLLEQQKYVNTQGVEIISAFIDPLDGIASNLCIRKMQGKAHMYFRDLFGSGLGGICSGLGTDRLRIEWQSNYSRPVVNQAVNEYGDRDKNVVAIIDSRSRGNFREVINYKLNLSDPILLVEIPDDFQAIKSADIGFATSWRNSIREILEGYLRNYSLVSFHSEYAPARRNYFILKKNKLYD